MYNDYDDDTERRRTQTRDEKNANANNVRTFGFVPVSSVKHTAFGTIIGQFFVASLVEPTSRLLTNAAADIRRRRRLLTDD